MCEAGIHCKGLPSLISPLATTSEAKKSFKRLQQLQKGLCWEILLSHEAVNWKCLLGNQLLRAAILKKLFLGEPSKLFNLRLQGKRQDFFKDLKKKKQTNNDH